MKNKKGVGLIAMILTISSVTAFAQSSSKVIGLYKNESDFAAGILTYQIQCNAKQNSIHPDKSFAASTITIKEDGKKFDVAKKDFFGYKDCSNKSYRFFDGKVYEIVDTAGFYMYKRTALASGKGYVMVTEYYFSIDAGSPLQVLSKSNLENAFAANTRFRYAIQTAFQNNNELSAYDSYLKCYKVKHVFVNL
ncbi:MAG TPA: hypothetical protein VK718_10980 [Ferruginibacter sp.]|jgi:hypothetical protein|nr:hypothetical protein [Ferruginibacter sp.]